MARLDAVQAKLVQDERELQAEIDALQEALTRDQDPGRMQLIQEMISVFYFSSAYELAVQVFRVGPPRANVMHT